MSPQPSSIASATTSRSFFAKRGTLSRWHPQYEFRPGQLEMAEAVESALADRRHLIVEAGTGTGKTLAYLVPAILSGRRVIVSTGTKNLQEQLYFRDIPFLQSHFDRPIEACYMKGRSNYACRQKIYDAQREPVLEGLEEVNDFSKIVQWEQVTATGDRAEIESLSEHSTAWLKVDARRELCSGQKCPQYDRCFLTEMHRKAAASDLIIVNHALFFADLAVRETEFASILPDYQAVIFDEAHEIEEIAGQYFGFSISNLQLTQLCRDVLALSRRKQFATPELDQALIQVETHAAPFFALFGESDGRYGFRNQRGLLDEHAEIYASVLLTLEILAAHLELADGSLDEMVPLLRRVKEIGERLRSWMESPEDAYVYWVERRGRGCFLQATPIDVSSLLAEKLFGAVDTVVMTSATLAVGGSFEYLQKRLGVPQARTLTVAAPFDYPSQALLYVPQHLPDPRASGYVDAAAGEIAALLELSEGRAFVLCTATQQMRLLYQRVAELVDYPLLMQGSSPRHVLLDQFRRTPQAVLFATAAFWQGVDVPGDQLSCVIIDKLPFAAPTDPVVEARISAIKRDGGKPFFDFQIPEAAIALKQGFGRLIRSRTDRGVLALLDHRITRNAYGQLFFDSLPDYAFTMDRADVERFFECLK